MPKNDHPVNEPECRLIEHFWAILKQQVYKNNWRAKNVKQFYRRIQYCLNKLYGYEQKTTAFFISQVKI